MADWCCPTTTTPPWFAACTPWPGAEEDDDEKEDEAENVAAAADGVADPAACDEDEEDEVDMAPVLSSRLCEPRSRLMNLTRQENEGGLRGVAGRRLQAGRAALALTKHP